MRLGFLHFSGSFSILFCIIVYASSMLFAQSLLFSFYNSSSFP
jgi:hypothetical protein